LSINGSSPSLGHVGHGNVVDVSSLRMFFSAKGLVLGNWHLVPNADGSVHIPNSDRSRAGTRLRGKVSMVFLFA